MEYIKHLKEFYGWLHRVGKEYNWKIPIVYWSPDLRYFEVKDLYRNNGYKYDKIWLPTKSLTIISVNLALKNYLKLKKFIDISDSHCPVFMHKKGNYLYIKIVDIYGQDLVKTKLKLFTLSIGKTFRRYKNGCITCN